MFYAHPDALVAMPAPTSSSPADFVVTGDFAATEWTVEPVSTDAHLWISDNYGPACASINIRKSALPTFASHVAKFGLTV
jgi:hypothetical protein